MMNVKANTNESGPASRRGPAGALRAAWRWARLHVPLAIVIAVVVLGLTGTIVAWAAEVLAQVPSYDWYTDDPNAAEFEIASAGDLRGLSELVNGTADIDDDGTVDFPAVSFQGATIVQTRKIGLASQEFTPIGTPEHPFAGTYDGGYDAAEGAGMDIRTLQISQSSEYVGLFGYCSAESTLKNIYLSDVAGAGFEPANVTLSDASTDLVANSYAEGDYHVIHDVGSIVGYTAGSIEGCESRAAVVVSSNRTATNDEPLVIAEVGGIAGTCLGSIANSAYHADLTVEAPSLASDTSDAVVANVGGVVGTLGAYDEASRTTTAGTISGCHFGFSDTSGDFGIGALQATIQVTTTGVGGLDRFGVEKEACSTCVGGIAGYSYGSITDCINYGLVNANSTPVKLYKDSRNLVHIVKADDTRPASYPLAENTFAMANGANGVGGIVGSLRGSGIGTGAVSRESSIGTADTPITLSMCFNTGTVAGLANVGGIAGRTGTYATIDSCRNGKPDTANGTGTSDDSGHIVSTRWNKPMTGGIAGVAGASITNCANLSEVENIQTGYYTAGIVGSLSGADTVHLTECSACFNAGLVHVRSHATTSYREAGIVGQNSGYVHDCVMRSGSVLAHDDDGASYPNAAIGDANWGAWSNIKFFSTSELKKSDAAAVLNASHANDVLPYVHGDGSADDWVYWYIASNGYPTLNAWDAPDSSKQIQLNSANTSAKCIQFAEYAGNVEAIPELYVVYTANDGTQVTLVQNVDFYVLPQKGATEMTNPDAPYQASIIGIGNYAGTVENVCNYGIGPCDLANCEVSTSSATYNFDTCVYPDAVYVTNPAGSFVEEEEYRYVIYSDQTFLLNKNVTKNYVVFDSEGYVSWDGGATRQTVESQHDKLVGDLAGVDYVLYNSAGEAIYRVTEAGTKQSAVDPDTGLEVAAKGPTYNKSRGTGIYSGAPGGFVVQVFAKDDAPALKHGTSNTGQFVIDPLDLNSDCAIDKVEVDVPSADGTSKTTQTWYWDSTKSVLYALDEKGNPVLGKDGNLKQASIDFTGGEIKPTAQISYTKADGTNIVIPEGRLELRWYSVYGDPNTENADLEYVNRDATPLTVKDGVAAESIAQANKDAGLTKHERAALTARSVLNRSFSNYVSMYFTINPVSLEQCMVKVGGAESVGEGELATYAYRGGYGVRPSVSIKRCGNTLLEDVDYSVEYENNVEPTTQEAIQAYLESGDTSGLASYTIKGLGNISTSSTKTDYFIIAEGKSLSEEGYTIAPIPDQQFNFGYAVQPKDGVHLNDADGKDSGLVEGRDYEVVYKNNVVNRPSATAKAYVYGINGYTGMLSTTFDIVPFDMNDPENAYRISELEYSNDAYKTAGVPAGNYAFSARHRRVKAVVDWETGALEDESHGATYRALALQNKKTDEVYSFDLDDPAYVTSDSAQLIPPGEYTCTMRYGLECTGVETYDMTVVKNDLAIFGNFECNAVTYNGEAQEPRILGAYLNRFDVTYEDNVNAGTARYYVSAKDGDELFTGTYQGVFTINKINLSDVSVTVCDQIYTGEELTPAVKATCGDYHLVQGVDFNAVYINNQRKGIATVHLEGIGNCEGEATATFKIGNTLDISKADIDPVPDQIYTGSAIEPKPNVAYDGVSLAEGTDYSLEYSDNIAVSTAKKPAVVKIVGLGKYSNSAVTATFNIVNIRDIAEAACIIPDQVYTGSTVEPQLTITYGNETLTEDVDYSVSFRRNVKAGGQAFALVTGMGSYEGTLKVPFNIVVRNGVLSPFGEHASSAVDFSVEVANETNPGDVDGAIVIWERDYPSQIAAVPLSAVTGYPILLTGNASLAAQARTYLSAHHVREVIAIGESGALADTVLADLDGMKLEVATIVEEDSSLVSQRIAERLVAETESEIPTAVIANPADYSAAAGIAAWSVAMRVPLVFTDEDGTLGDDAKSLLSRCDSIVIVGDYDSVDSSVEDDLTLSASIVRLAGATDAETNARIVAYGLEHGLEADGALVLNAKNLTNELAAVRLAAIRKAPLALIRESDFAAIGVLREADTPAHGLTIVGDFDAFTQEMRDEVSNKMGWSE